MNNKQNYSIYIPCYNCAPQISRVIGNLAQAELSWIKSIVFVDNCSQDDTCQVICKEAKRLSTDCHLISHKENYGLGGSFKTAVNHARANNNYLIWLHGDDQASPSELINLQPHIQNSVDVVFGARFMRESQLFNYSKMRTAGNKFINLIYSIVLGKRIYELGSGLNMYKLDALPLDELEQWPNHIAFDANLLFHFIKNKKHIQWMPISWREKDQVSNARNIRVATDLLKMLLCFRLRGKTITHHTNTIQRKFQVEEL